MENGLQLKQRIKQFAELHGITPSFVTRKAIGDPAFYGRLRADSSIRDRTRTRLDKWMQNYSCDRRADLIHSG